MPRSPKSTKPGRYRGEGREGPMSENPKDAKPEQKPAKEVVPPPPCQRTRAQLRKVAPEVLTAELATAKGRLESVKQFDKGDPRRLRAERAVARAEEQIMLNKRFREGPKAVK